jgi:hypothetical protein
MAKPKNYKKAAFSSMKEIECSKCGSVMKVADDTISGICWRCVAKGKF